MTFRRRIVLLTAAAVAGAIALGAIMTYIIVGHELRASVDRALSETRPEVTFVARQGDSASVPAPRADGSGNEAYDQVRVQVPGTAFGATKGIAQATFISGETILPDAPAQLPVTQAVKDVAAGKRGSFLRDV
ncbi:MAG TPA: hypothetical protein VNT55_24780, partial [Baekduia sp.]|nr:hypothetical protein [Baekduia sp.]